MRNKLSLIVVVLLAILTFSASSYRAMSSAAEFDLVITNGLIVDGTGNPWFAGNVAIKDGRIAEIGQIAAERGARVIDARGRIVAPGFIDVHAHIETNPTSGIEKLPTADNYLQMGVTSVVTGNCGSSELSLGDWFAKLEKGGVSLNIASLIGHNSVRRNGMNGDFDRSPTPEELERMRQSVERAMCDGAVGLSTGLIYVPGTYAKTDEILELAKVAARYGGLYATHMRDEGLNVEQAIRESLEIGKQANCSVEISHFKVLGKKLWGNSTRTIKLIEEARAQGQSVTVDQYLYAANATSLSGYLFPKWLFDGGQEKTKERLQNQEMRKQIKREMIEEANRLGFQDMSFEQVANYFPNPTFNGKNIAEITRLTRNKTGIEEEVEQMMDMLLAYDPGMVFYMMSEDDVERIFRQPFTMVAADGGVRDQASPGVPHPRSFGNNVRALGVYVREKKLVSLEDGIRKMTSLPAQTFKLWERGLLRPGMAADIVIFDEKIIADRATFQQPKQYPVGIDYVLVNGQVVIEKGRHTGVRPGQILRGRGKSN